MKQVLLGRVLVLLLLVVFLSAACGRSPSEPSTPTEATAKENTPAAQPTAIAVETAVPATPTAAPRPIRVIKTAPVTSVASNEVYPFSNCGGTVSLRQSFSEAAQVSAEVAISDQATRSDGTVVGVDEARRAELIQEVELAYEPELAAARTAVDEEEMVAAPFTRWNVIIIWEQRVFAAAVSYPGDGLTATAAYTYTQQVPSLGYFGVMPCTA